MKNRLSLTALTFIAVLGLASFAKAQTQVVLKTNHGDITIEVDEANAPLSAANFLAYVDEGYYD
ncbi:MAG: peptidylprolyl isomerase, partial [Verrucomicrobiota bacterium]